MGEPTINEKRPDAHVIVYGDSAPITDAEWRCARLAWQQYASPLLIEVTAPQDGCEGRVYAGTRKSLGATYPTRERAAAACAEMLCLEMDAIMRSSEETARRYREDEAMAAGRAKELEARVARLRALLAGAPDAAHGGPRG